MDTIKTLAYAGLGLAVQTNEKVKNQFNELVELGKKSEFFCLDYFDRLS